MEYIAPQVVEVGKLKDVTHAGYREWAIDWVGWGFAYPAG